jgi:hypothetical protein
MKVQNDVVADIAGNILRSELDATVLDRLDALGREVRAAVPAMPPPSTKTYLGTVTMRPDRTLDVVVEQYSVLRKDGTYPLVVRARMRSTGRTSPPARRASRRRDALSLCRRRRAAERPP